MNQFENEAYRRELGARRERLIGAISSKSGDAHLTDLLQQVDQALERLRDGKFGICETCHDPIEPDRLAVDPLLRFCLDHLSEAEQRYLQRDLEMASAIQTSLLPKNGVEVPGWLTEFHFQPSGPVSGDYCDLVPASDGSLYFFIGDVSGKGVSASLLMAHLHAIMRTLVESMPGTAEIVLRANRLFCEGTAQKNFATLVAGRAFPDGTVELTTAAHCPVFVVRSDRVERISPAGLPLGLFCQIDPAAQRISLKKGDSLFLCTDGLLEARDERNELFGEERLERLLRQAHREPPRKVLERCKHDLASFLRSGKLFDDLTLMTIARS